MKSSLNALVLSASLFAACASNEPAPGANPRAASGKPQAMPEVTAGSSPSGENHYATSGAVSQQVASSAPAPAVGPELAMPADFTATPAKTPDVVYVPTPQPVVDQMLAIAKIKKTDVVYDLGCGDGRIVVTAAKKYGVRAYGFDVDPDRVAEARKNVEDAGVQKLVTIEQKDIFTLDLRPASVVTLYLLPELNVRLIPQLERLKPGSRIVSHDFDMQGVAPVKHLRLTPESASREHEIFLWTAPLRKASNEASKK